MYWYKVKTLLIYMFAAINIFLIVFILQGRVRQEMAEKKEIQSLVEVLNINGISANEDIFLKDSEPVKTAQVENLVPGGEEAAKLMLGEGFAQETDEVGNTIYTGGGKILSVSGGKLYYYDSNLVSDAKLSEEKISLAAEKLKSYGVDVSSAKGAALGDKIVFTYYFDNLPLFENTLYVKMSGESICEVGGYMIGMKAQEGAQTRVAPPKKALISFLQDKNRKEGAQKILSVSLGYSALLADSSVNFKITETIPTYKITTDNYNVYYYDARE